MNARERRRLTEFSRVKDGLMSVAEAARSLGLSERQGRRLWKAYREKGDAGLIHGLRGRPSNFRPAVERSVVLACYQQKYRGCNASHAADLLADREGLSVPRTTLWRYLKAEHLIVQERKPQKHRKRRLRRACVGELLQMDGSTHRWFGPAHPACVLFVMIDDATGEVFCRFYASEDTAAAFDLFGRYVRRHGLPEALYVDHDSIYVVNDEQAREHCRQAGKKPPLTQFGRAMEELGVTILAADSPQAKGRVERVNRTLQDRLLNELALALDGRGIREIAAANAFLEHHFLKAFNRRFGRVPACGLNRHRNVPAGVRLTDVLCHQETRIVGRDWCVRFANRIVQIDGKHTALALAGKPVVVLARADGRLELRHRGRPLRSQEVACRPIRKVLPARALGPDTPWRPGPDHPWKQGGFLTGSRRDRSAVKAVPFQGASQSSAPFHSTALTADPKP